MNRNKLLFTDIHPTYTDGIKIITKYYKTEFGYSIKQYIFFVKENYPNVRVDSITDKELDMLLKLRINEVNKIRDLPKNQ